MCKEIKMPITKHALIRYSALDKCLSNSGRYYSFNDLLDHVNKALIDYNNELSGVGDRTLRYDIQFMKSEEGYNAPIETINEGRKCYYRYYEKFSIHNHPLNESERLQIKNLLHVLRKFEGRPEFEFLNEIGPIFADKFGVIEKQSPIIGYDTNIDYSGAKWIPQLFNAISNKRCLSIHYQTFTGDGFTGICHPYYIKQFNNRWFLFAGRNDRLSIKDNNKLSPIWNYPLDRIVELFEVDHQFIESNIEWEDYFYDIIGVTKIDNSKIEEVKLKFSKEMSGYIITKPLHPTQKVNKLEDGEIEVRIKVMLNYELESLILSFGKHVKVIEPNKLVTNVKKNIQEVVSKYK